MPPRISNEAMGVPFYIMCSSVALVANKMVMHYMQVPGLVFCLQITITVTFIFVASFHEVIEVDPLTWRNTVDFLPYIASFVLTLYSNGKALTVSNVETVIVFRACAPLLVSVLDWQFLGRELPNRRSLLSLLGLVGGAICYVMADSEFKLHGLAAYKWVTLNLMGVVFEMTYGKKLLSGVQMKAPVWGATLYTNLLALVPMFCVAAYTGELQAMQKVDVQETGVRWLVLSCIIGIGISWSGWNCRHAVSATVFTVLGVVCKFISVVLNVLLWDKHASLAGMIPLCVCLLCSALYQQAPLREVSRKGSLSQAQDNVAQEINAEKALLLGAKLAAAGSQSYSKLKETP
mmetsp:Transcript_26098/g.60879  ORF Transcript_26098/g.60879 Transcript_26098/m.60879 type:complete len:347 (+) Transcript_26098:110-1150(+)|eukprot:CAMPEP_0178425660 /NCGR_PEP_ID=MMETSP0689_2-20121128/28836_1 /TAXON_ID=160604 /ORGANISM="Amphidinium massartii, Strain CS-259" /LENGTH=346 /DNA_ID=CAMNT_0020047327 /DNA_START=106 /DNA_END=1146 /DNA_ORIENTATION=+